MAYYTSPLVAAQDALAELQSQQPSNPRSDEFADWSEMVAQAQQDLNAAQGQLSGQIDVSGGVDPILAKIRADLAAWGGAGNIVSAIDQGAPLSIVYDALEQLQRFTTSGANAKALNPIVNFAEVAQADLLMSGGVTGVADPLQNIRYSLLASGEAPELAGAIQNGATLEQIMPALINYRWTTTNPKNVGKLDPLLGAGWYALAAENAAKGLPPPDPLPTFPEHQGTWAAVGTALTDYILPAALALTPIGPVAGAALGSALGSTIQERDFEDGLIRAALAAGTAFAGSAITGVDPWGALNDAALGATTAGATAPATGGLTGPTVQPLSTSQILSAIGQTPPITNALTGAVISPGAFTSLIPETVIMGTLPAVTSPSLVGAATGALGGLSGAISGAATTAVPDVTVTADMINQPPIEPLDVLTGLSAGAGIMTATGGTTPQTPKPPSEGGGVKGEPGTSISDIIDYIGLGAKGLSLLGALGVGGTGAGGAGGGGGMLAPPSLPPGYGYGTGPGTLPTITTGPGAPSAARPVNMSMDDWLTYAMRPEASFFTDVPMRAAAGGMAVKRPPKPSFAVRGKGDGRSDEIPALLSDGEYVIDAETVALLGNGSGKAGAEALDRFRANVRRHKGRELSKGRFSVNAKKPEKYLTGGRT
jgi:hypothetical protein